MSPQVLAPLRLVIVANQRRSLVNTDLLTTDLIGTAPRYKAVRVSRAFLIIMDISPGLGIFSLSSLISKSKAYAHYEQNSL